MPKILYEDNHILVAEKPPNLPVQGDSSGDADMLSLLKDYIKEKYGKPGAVYLGLVHRLDRPVGGVMVFARTSKAAARLSAQFAGREAEKRYAAIVEGAPPAAGWEGSMLSGFIRKEEDGTARLCSEDAPGAKAAKLVYRPLGRDGDHTLLDIRLLTGRKHQIRLQLAGEGWPILHDQRYNPAARPGNQICLWAYSLRFTHPTRKEEMHFTSLPEGGDWARFPAAVAALPAHRVCAGVWLDERILAVAKGPGVEAADGPNPLSAQLEPLFGRLWPVHRLDANTEGMLLYARTEDAAEALTAAFREGRADKRYLAVVCGLPNPREAALTAYAVKDASAARVRVYDAPREGAKTMRTDYRVLESAGGLSLLEIRLHTGRTHQIRAHMAHIGHPVLGDDLYGDREKNRRHHVRRQLLLAQSITLTFPPDSPLADLSGKAFQCPWGLELPK